MFVSESEMQYDSLLQTLGCDDSEEHIVICKEEMPVCISLCEKGFLEKGTPVILLNCVGGDIICMKALHGGTECFAEIKTVLNCTCFSREIQQMYSDGKAVEQYYQSQKQDTDFLENSSALLYYRCICFNRNLCVSVFAVRLCLCRNGTGNETDAGSHSDTSADSFADTCIFPYTERNSEQKQHTAGKYGSKGNAVSGNGKKSIGNSWNGRRKAYEP